MAPADSAAFHGDVSHSYANPGPGDRPARFALTVLEPHPASGGAR